MPRSRPRDATPATRAARAMRSEPARRSRAGALSVSVKLGQLLVFAIALALLGLYTVSDQLARDEGFHVRVTWVSLVLLGIAALVVVLPRILRATGPAGSAGVDLSGWAHDAALTAAAVAPTPEVAAGAGRALPSPALTLAARDPLTSIELSRRALATELRRLTAAAGITAPASSLAGFADQLYAAGLLRASEARAIGELSAVIDVARESGSVAAVVAQDVDDATQRLVPVLDERFELTTRRPAPPPVDYEDFDLDLDLDVEDADLPEPAADLPEPAADLAEPAANATPEAVDAVAVDEVAVEEDDDDVEIDLREPAASPVAERGLAERGPSEPTHPDGDGAGRAVAWRSTVGDTRPV